MLVFPWFCSVRSMPRIRLKPRALSERRIVITAAVTHALPVPRKSTGTILGRRCWCARAARAQPARIPGAAGQSVGGPARTGVVPVPGPAAGAASAADLGPPNQEGHCRPATRPGAAAPGRAPSCLRCAGPGRARRMRLCPAWPSAYRCRCASPSGQTSSATRDR